MNVLTAFYDLTFGPVSYDFVTWLVRAMKERDARNCDGLHIVIVPKDGGLGGFARNWGSHDEAATRWRLWHIVMASVPLARATVTLAHSQAHARSMIGNGEVWWQEGKAHFMGPLVDAARRGETIPKLQATDAARRYVDEWKKSDFMRNVKYVTLTTRSQGTDPDRNTDRKAIARMEMWLSQAGFYSIELQDSHVELSSCLGHFAILDPDLRLALYERAAMNIIGNNGPQELLKFSSAPYLAFGQALSDGWKDHFRKYFNLAPGEQLPWATAKQRLVYLPDTFENLCREFEAAMARTQDAGLGTKV